MNKIIFLDIDGVLNDSSRPIDRASVIVRFVEGRAYLKLGKKIRDTYELRTNQEGEVTLPEIPQGKILIQVIAHGYQTFGQTFDASSRRYPGIRRAASSCSDS